MTVVELAALLQTFSQDAEVVLLDTDAYPTYLHAVSMGKACDDDDGDDKLLLAPKW